MDLNAIYITILGIVLLVRRYLLINLRLINQGQDKISFAKAFNSFLSPTGFLFLLILIPIKKNKDSNVKSVFWINLFTILGYLIIIWIIMVNILTK